jgi:hypothetical protein
MKVQVIVRCQPKTKTKTKNRMEENVDEQAQTNVRCQKGT